MTLKLVFFLVLSCYLTAILNGNPIENSSTNDTTASNLKSLTLRVYRGRKVTRNGEFPYQVSIQLIEKGKRNPFKFCGGTIIDESWILTAAHCVSDGNTTDLYINAGTYNAYCYKDSSQKVQVKEIHVHPKYDETLITDDIALLKLKRPLRFNEYVDYAIVPAKGFVPTGTGIVTGWGKTGPHDEDECKILRKGYVKIWDWKECKENVWDTLSENGICIGKGTENSTSICAGDSGGPLVVKSDYEKNHNPTVVGVCSYGTEGCSEDPAVYTNVAFYSDWIDQVMIG